MTVGPSVRSTLFAAVSGFLTRPCCVVPAVMSFAGVGSAHLSDVLGANRVWFLLTSTMLLGAASVINFRRDGGWFNKTLTMVASAIAFAVAAGWVGGS